MKISNRSGNRVDQREGKLAMVLMVVGTMLTGPALALTSDNVAPLGSQTKAAGTEQYSPGVQEILKMTDAKVDLGVVTAFIKNSPTAYSLSADDIIKLKKQAVPDAIITEMIQHGAEVRNQLKSAVPPTPGATPPQYATPPPTQSAPPLPYDYGVEDYGYPSAYPYDYSTYPYYSFSYPYGYNYWWWSSYGYPWYGYYSPYFYFDVFGHRHFRGFDHGRFAHYGGYYDRFGRGRGFNGGRGFGTSGRGQPWRPVGHFSGRSIGRGSFSPSRSFAARPSGGFVSHSPSFAVRSGGVRAAGGGFHGGGSFRSGGGFHGGGGFGGHGMGGHR